MSSSRKPRRAVAGAGDVGLAFAIVRRDDGRMAECPGVLHLAAMADGGLARLRAPGGVLTAAQLRAVAEAAATLGSGVVDLTNRANLQIRGLAPDGGRALAESLEAAGFRFDGEADRRRNILLDPFSGLDPTERRDLSELARTLDDALTAAPWIGGLSPKFSYALDGGGSSEVSGVPSDVRLVATAEGLAIAAGSLGFVAEDEDAAVGLLVALAEAAVTIGPRARASDLAPGAIGGMSGVRTAAPQSVPGAPVARFGVVATHDLERVAISVPVPVGRLDAVMLGFLADVADADGEGRVALAPWSAVVVPGVAEARAAALLAASERVGFTSVAVAERLSVTACAGAEGCERALEPAKALGAAVLTLGAARPEALPVTRKTLHLSACSKGCAGSAAADLLLLGSSDEAGWSLRKGSPRRPGPPLGRLDDATPAAILEILVARG